MRKKVNIIGAGIAGLSAGCYLQMNGYDTEIFELHALPGGLCTSWERKGYTIDGCIHWLVGSSPGNKLYHLWNELIDMKSIRFVDYEEYMRFEDKDGNFIVLFSDVDRLEKEMLEKAREDKDLILEFTKTVRKFANFDLPVHKAPETYGLFDAGKMIFKMLPYIRDLKKWISITEKEYGERFSNPLLGKTIAYSFFPEMAVLFIIMNLAWMHNKSAGYPVGGSMKFAKLLETRYLELGGRINYKSRVNRIITEKDSAKGIVLENGESHRADIIISAADGHSTIFQMLEGRYTNQKIMDYYANYETFPSYLQVSLGIARTFENEPHMTVFPADKPLVIDSSVTYESLPVRIFNFDPTLAPAGKTLLTLMFLTPNHRYWDELRTNDREKYKKEKERIANEIIDMLEKRFGSIKSNVEMVDVSTPSTVIRYTNNWKGSFEGWVLTPKIGFGRMQNVLPGLSNFYMAGQWVVPGGGLPSAILSGRNVTQVICKKDKNPFKTTAEG
jgi:phytoene dehydrogenase-like protein